MKKTLLILLFCLPGMLAPVVRADVSQASVDSLLHELDKTLHHRSQYLAEKEARLETLRHSLTPDLTDFQRFARLGDLLNEYRSYNTDSAWAVTHKRLEIARRMGDSACLADARMNVAELLSIAGMYKEALEQMGEVHRDSLPDYLQSYYYHNLRTLYNWMADYAILPEVSKRYLQQMEHFNDTLMTCRIREGNEYAYLLNRCQKLNGTGHPDEAIKLMQEVFDKGDIRFRAVLAYTLAESYHQKQDVEMEKRYLTIAAIADLQAPVLEYAALPRLAVLLFHEGDVERAYIYLKQCMEDAVACNARLRILEILKIFPVVNDVYQLQISKRQRQMAVALTVISLLSVCLVWLLVYARRQMKRVMEARHELMVANDRLSELNRQLQLSNAKLKEANQCIVENTILKETYIGRYMEQCSIYLQKLDAYRRELGKLASAGKLQELYAQLKSTKLIEEERKRFYDRFDDTFLQLFPNFVEDFNALLQPEERITVKPGERMNTELRIYALIRLGITDSTKIASFLHYSVTTIYNYRVKVRNKVAGNRDELEGKVARIGRPER